GNDFLSGGGGADVIEGGPGQNTLLEQGNNRFVLTDTSLDMGQGTDAVQSVTLDSGVTGGTFQLSYDGATTADIPFNATPDAFKAALTGLDSIGPEDVIVTGAAGAWTIEFSNNLAGMPIDALTATSNLVGGGATPITVATTTTGVRVVSTLAHIQS